MTDQEIDEVNDSDESFPPCKECGNTLTSFSEVKDLDGLCGTCYDINSNLEETKND